MAAIVALVDLSNKNVGTSSEAETPWLLYTVIGVSAVVIVAAVPLCCGLDVLQSRGSDADRLLPQPEQSAFGDPVQTTNLRPTGGPAIRRQPTPPAISRVGFPTAAVEQIYLRCPVAIASAMGAAAALIGVATYLAGDRERGRRRGSPTALPASSSWRCPCVPVFFLRQLRAVLA